MHCRPQKRMASETHLTTDMPICDNILPLFVIYSVVHVLLWVFNRIKEGFGSDHCIVMVLHLLMSFFFKAYASL